MHMLDSYNIKLTYNSKQPIFFSPSKVRECSGPMSELYGVLMLDIQKIDTNQLTSVELAHAHPNNM